MEDPVPFGSRAYLVMLVLLVFSRGMDFLSTWVATPNLVLEGIVLTMFDVRNKLSHQVAAEIMQRNNLKPDDISYLVPHQANLRIIDATGRRMGLPPDKVMINIENYGNTTAATIPLCIWDYENKLKKGDVLILAAFGGGFTWGSVYLKWAYDPR